VYNEADKCPLCPSIMDTCPFVKRAYALSSPQEPSDE